MKDLVLIALISIFVGCKNDQQKSTNDEALQEEITKEKEVEKNREESVESSYRSHGDGWWSTYPY
jgi:uncharacterized protein YcfL